MSASAELIGSSEAAVDSATRVLLSRNGLEVIWADAGVGAAQMVDCPPFRDRSDLKRIGEAMDPLELAANKDLPVPVLLLPACPRPTPVGLSNTRPQTVGIEAGNYQCHSSTPE